MADLEANFATDAFTSLDSFALVATQAYNLGGKGDWFVEFRGGLHGFLWRLYGVSRHYQEVHAWLPRRRHPAEVEYHLASVFFHMDSALECLCFALNSLGWATSPSDFHDITDGTALRRIGPRDALGGQPGYGKFFPTFQGLWKDREPLIARIRDLHDVSKHRRMVFSGGQARSDPPVGFFEAIGVSEGAVRADPTWWPMAEIILRDDPKIPAVARLPRPIADYDYLERVTPEFVELVDRSGIALLADANATIHLNDHVLRAG